MKNFNLYFIIGVSLILGSFFNLLHFFKKDSNVIWQEILFASFISLFIGTFFIWRSRLKIPHVIGPIIRDELIVKPIVKKSIVHNGDTFKEDEEVYFYNSLINKFQKGKVKIQSYSTNVQFLFASADGLPSNYPVIDVFKIKDLDRFQKIHQSYLEEEILDLEAEIKEYEDMIKSYSVRIQELRTEFEKPVEVLE